MRRCWLLLLPLSMGACAPDEEPADVFGTPSELHRCTLRWGAPACDGITCGEPWKDAVRDAYLDLSREALDDFDLVAERYIAVRSVERASFGQTEVTVSFTFGDAATLYDFRIDSRFQDGVTSEEVAALIDEWDVLRPDPGTGYRSRSEMEAIVRDCEAQNGVVFDLSGEWCDGGFSTSVGPKFNYFDASWSYEVEIWQWHDVATCTMYTTSYYY